MKRTLLVGVIMVCLLVLGHGQPVALNKERGESSHHEKPVTAESLLASGIRYHDIAARGKSLEYITRAEECLSRVLAIAPANTVAMVYFGSLQTIIARDRAPMWKKLTYMKKGFRHMDRAVELDPDSPHVRLVRAINSATVPKMFKRRHLVEEDFKHIDELTGRKDLEI